MFEQNEEIEVKHDEIVVKISKNVTLLDAVCLAMHATQHHCRSKDLHQTIKPSLSQERIDVREGESAFIDGQWKNQINVMLG